MNQTLKQIQRVLKQGCEISFRASYKPDFVEVVVTRVKKGKERTSMFRMIDPYTVDQMLSSKVDALADTIEACYKNLEQYERGLVS